MGTKAINVENYVNTDLTLAEIEQIENQKVKFLESGTRNVLIRSIPSSDRFSNSLSKLYIHFIKEGNGKLDCESIIFTPDSIELNNSFSIENEKRYSEKVKGQEIGYFNFLLSISKELNDEASKLFNGLKNCHRKRQFDTIFLQSKQMKSLDLSNFHINSFDKSMKLKDIISETKKYNTELYDSYCKICNDFKFLYHDKLFFNELCNVCFKIDSFEITKNYQDNFYYPKFHVSYFYFNNNHFKYQFNSITKSCLQVNGKYFKFKDFYYIDIPSTNYQNMVDKLNIIIKMKNENRKFDKLSYD